jgi:hypothetical protein
MNRVYHHHDRLEEYEAGLWRQTSGAEHRKLVAFCVAFMNDTAAFAAAMADVVDQWPFSCEHNLSASNVNRVAWLGQAACCVAIGAPEGCTRVAWHLLSDDARAAANEQARFFIEEWEEARTPTLFGRTDNAKRPHRD